MEIEKLIGEAEQVVKTEGADLWSGSVCAACEISTCYGTCPGYAEWEQKFLAERKSKFQHEQELKKRCHFKNTST